MGGEEKSKRIDSSDQQVLTAGILAGLKTVSFINS
jgi:hypothetical protein